MGRAALSNDDVTVAIPTIPPRRYSMLPHALSSVWKQTRLAAAVAVVCDLHRESAAVTRQRALDMVMTPWTAFLDDDDRLYPEHIELLMGCAEDTGADYVYSYWDLTRTADVFAERDATGRVIKPGHFGQPFDPANPVHTTMTVLVRTELAKSVGFTRRPDGDIAGGEDWRFLLGCNDLGAKIVHVPRQTWFWHHHDGNTSGREDRW
jgi:Glycosyl transferase family 2